MSSIPFGWQCPDYQRQVQLCTVETRVCIRQLPRPLCRLVSLLPGPILRLVPIQEPAPGSTRAQIRAETEQEHKISLLHIREFLHHHAPCDTCAHMQADNPHITILSSLGMQLAQH